MRNAPRLGVAGEAEAFRWRSPPLACNPPPRRGSLHANRRCCRSGEREDQRPLARKRPAVGLVAWPLRTRRLRVVRAIGTEHPRRLAISFASKARVGFSSRIASACAPVLGVVFVVLLPVRAKTTREPNKDISGDVPPRMARMSNSEGRGLWRSTKALTAAAARSNDFNGDAST